MKLITHLVLLLLFSIAVQAQHPNIIKARSLIDAGKTSKAIALLNKAYAKNEEKDLVLELIRIHTEEKDHSKALELAENAGLSVSSSINDAVLYIDLLIANGDYKAALDHSLKTLLIQQDADLLYDRAYICESLLKAEKNAIKYGLSEVPFNTSADEISIANYRKHYVLSSNRVTENADASSKEDYFDLFMLKQNYGKWRYPYFLLNERNPEVNRTTVCYSIDGNRVFYTLSGYISAKERKKHPAQNPVFTIHEGLSMGNKWESGNSLPFMKKGSSYKDPALHPNGQLLVFSSDASGSGGFDLFYSELVDGAWSSPINLGGDVNTAYNETMAYFSEDGLLYFSSSNPLGFGGYDIYMTENDNGIWLKPQILPPPINSRYDDLSYTRHFGRPGGYIVSNRPGGKGGYDVYEFVEFNYKLGVTVLDASNGSVLGMAEIQLSQDEVPLEHRLTNSAGLAEFPIGKNAVYTISVAKEGYLVGTETVSTANAEQDEILYANVLLHPDPAFTPASAENEQLFNNQNFIEFTAHITDEDGQPLPGLPVNLINTTTKRMKIVETDKSGAFNQSLFLGNNYAFVIEYGGMQIEEAFSTLGIEVPAPIERTYVLKGK